MSAGADGIPDKGATTCGKKLGMPLAIVVVVALSVPVGRG